MKTIMLPSVTTLQGVPIFWGDEKEADMGEGTLHVAAVQTIHLAVQLHLEPRPRFAVLADLNLIHASAHRFPTSYVSPDVMVVEPKLPLAFDASWYRIGEHGPAPLSVIEVLSIRSWEQMDVHDKAKLYAELGIAEYLLVDPVGTLMPERLVAKRLLPDGSYADEQDEDEGVTSRLGFRLRIEDNGLLRVIDAATGERYPRPLEAMRFAREKRSLESHARELEAELAWLKARLNPPGC